MALPEGFTEELLSRIDIVELIREFLPLKKMGANFTTRCPFHQEKTPSFNISPKLQRYHCFGCGVSGDAITFLREYQHMDFLAAVAALAQRVGMSVPQSSDRISKASKYRDLYELNELAAQYFHQTLLSQAGEEARTYLKARGISKESALQFQIGFATAAFDGLVQFMRQKGAAETHLSSLGLISRSQQNRIFDKFRHRLMFPIRDNQGRVLAFGGRSFGDAMPKYLNSPQTPLFNKSEVLYGLYEALQAKNIQHFLLVEGYLDVISLVQHGLPGVVATLGTALTQRHLERIFRYQQSLVFCFDGDLAGRAAALKAANIVLPELDGERNARFLLLPSEDDPDSLIHKEGRQAFVERINQALDISQFLINALKEDTDLATVNGRRSLLQRITPYLKATPSAVIRDLILEQLSVHTRTALPQLLEFLQQPMTQTHTKKAAPLKTLTPLRRALMLVLQHTHLAKIVCLDDLPIETSLPGYTLLKDVLEFLQKEPNLTTEEVLEAWEVGPEAAILRKLTATPMQVSAVQAEAEFRAALQKVQDQTQEGVINHMLERLAQGALNDEERLNLLNLLRNRSQDMKSKTVE